MLLDNFTTFGTKDISLLTSVLARKDMPVIEQFQPIADFEELVTFTEEHPTPVVFSQTNAAWQIESVAARIIESLAIAVHETLNDADLVRLSRILLELMEFLWTYPIATTSREKLAAGSSLALAACVCKMLPQSELWRLAGFGRIAANLSDVHPTSSDTHLTLPIDSAFSLGSILNLQILESAIESYNNVLERKITHDILLVFPLDDTDFFRYLNLDFDGLEDVKSAVSKGKYTDAKLAYTDYRNVYKNVLEDVSNVNNAVSFSAAKTYLECLLKTSIYPSPAILSTTEIGMAALLFPEFHFSEQLLKLAFRRYKWITESIFYPDGFHKDKLLRSQVDSVNNVSRFLHVFDKVNYPNKTEWISEMKTFLDKQLQASIYLSQPDFSFPKWFTTTVCHDLQTVELNKIKISNLSKFEYILSQRKNGTEPSEKSYAFPYSGVFVMRDSWKPEAQYLCFHNGPNDIQKYDDRLSFSLFANGKQLITENYQKEFENSEETDKANINTVLIDRLSQTQRIKKESRCTPVPDARWLTNTSFDFVTGEIKSKDFHHRRSIFYKKGEYYIIHDLILGDDEHTLEQIFNIATSQQKQTISYVLQENGQFWTQEKGRSNIFIGAAISENLDVSFDGNKLVYHLRCELPAVMNTLMYPMKNTIDQKPSIYPVSVSSDLDVLATGFQVKSNGIIDTFLISDDGYAKMCVQHTDRDIEFVGEYLFLRGDDFVMLNGRYLKVGTKVHVDFSEPCEYYVRFE